MLRTRTMIVGDRVCTIRKPYGFFAFMFDLFMVAITSGLWLIWIFVREMRAR